MKLDITYSELSFLREIVNKYKHEKWVKEVTSWDKKVRDKLDANDIEDLRQEFWKNHDVKIPLSDEDCALLVSKKLNDLELDCQIKLGLKQPAKKLEKVMFY
jgi:hypothetical protein